MNKLIVMILAIMALACADEPEVTECMLIQDEAAAAGRYARSVQGTDKYDSAYAAYGDLRREYANRCLY